jgi:hypothetical protein
VVIDVDDKTAARAAPVAEGGARPTTIEAKVGEWRQQVTLAAG